MPERPRNSAMNSRTVRLLPEVAIAVDMRGEIALQPGFVIPMSAGRIARAPLVPVGLGRLPVDELAAEQSPAQSEMRVEPRIASTSSRNRSETVG